jgi:polyisoprenoid-binding protein YceI
MLRALTIIALLLPGVAAAVPWTLSPETTVTVEVPWQGRSVPLDFPRIAGEIDFDERRPERASARIAVDARAVETGVGPVNALARSRDFLAAAEHPTIVFVLDRLVRTSPSTAEVYGDITLRGVTRAIAFQAVVLRYGPAKDDPARFEAGFDLTGSIDRTAFGSTGGLPAVPPVLPIRIRLLMTSK